MPILGIFSSAVVPVASYKFAVSSQSARIFLSTDAITWQWPAPNAFDEYTTADTRVENLWYLNGQRIARLDPTDALATSTDGITWDLLNCNIATPGKIIWDGTYYVAVENRSMVAYSTNLTTWTYSNYYKLNAADTIAHNNGTYVVMGSANFCYTSTNLTTWTSRSTGATSTTDWNDVTYGNKWVAVGYDTSAGLGRIRTSTDGISWDSRNPSATGASEAPESIEWNGSRYVAATDVVGTQSSTDGITWANGTGITGWSGGFNTAKYGGGNWVLCSPYTGYLYTSTNGTSWTAVNAFAAGGWDGASYDAMYDGSKWIFGADLAANTYNYWTSTNLTTFTARGYLKYRKPNINDMIWDGSRYIAVAGQGYLAVSTDATTWTSRTSTFGTSAINGIFYGNGIYVAVGAGGQLRTSTDTITWTSRTSNFATSQITKGTYGNGVYVVVGNAGKISSSTDAVTWTARTSNFGTSNIWNVAYNSGLFIAVGAAGKISTSTDGTTWTARTSGMLTTAALRDAFYATGIWVATNSTEANTSNYCTSTDGVTWTTRTTPTIGAVLPGLWSVNYSSSLNLWVTFTNSASTTAAAGEVYNLFTSTDAITWTVRTSTVFPPYGDGNVITL